MHIPFLLNWTLNPYHTPIVVAQKRGYFEANNIELAILEPFSPSDVTKIIGRGEIPLGLKAMIHCFAAIDRGFHIQSIGTLLDEPPTGLISLVDADIQKISDIKGKKLGYVGEFGKVMIDKLAIDNGIEPTEYQTVRIGMNAAQAIIDHSVDAAIGLSCYQQLEVEASAGHSHFLRIDEAADLGCCCFCSIMLISHKNLIETDPDLLKRFMRALYQGMQFTREDPQSAYEYMIREKPSLGSTLNKKIFHHCLPFFSKQLNNVERDWLKVAHYAKQLNILSEGMLPSCAYTNDFLPGQPKSKNDSTHAKKERIHVQPNR